MGAGARIDAWLRPARETRFEGDEADRADGEFSPAARRAVSMATLTVLSVTVLRAAWVSDDAYITFRTIDNWFHGYGLRWNIAERVQTYTHPLWMLVVAASYAVTREPYFTSIALSVAFTLAAAHMVINRLATGMAPAVAAVTTLILSRAFIDYSTSGLENALTHLLLALFFVGFFGSARGPRRLLALSGATALLAVNHADTVLLVLPLLIVAARREGWRTAIGPCALGFLPFVAWELFSVVYYGFPLPNTAYAKLTRTGIPVSELAPQGLLYLLDSITWDPITLATIAGASLWAVVDGMADAWPLVGGILLYLTWVVRIGGDFMSGRLLTAPLFCAIVIVARGGIL